jgi:hypothetical protein
MLQSIVQQFAPEFSKKEVHRSGVEPGHHQGDTSVAGRTYGPDDPSRLVADITQPARGMAALLPDKAGPPFLSDPRLVLAPDFKLLGLRMSLRDFRQAGSKPPFLTRIPRMKHSMRRFELSFDRRTQKRY